MLPRFRGDGAGVNMPTSLINASHLYWRNGHDDYDGIDKTHFQQIRFRTSADGSKQQHHNTTSRQKHQFKRPSTNIKEHDCNSLDYKLCPIMPSMMRVP